ncbi:hypothetical protein IHE45_15G108100 [Dioscorea alata]|uniref:Uncharacterized protein n=1 Tax=Dioscorea alata TaxID=55571 RepID=A0ACB7UNI9_DIOAL|nr:hypothetical protein IHE45_15G108100 [Dioscorea alata]
MENKDLNTRHLSEDLSFEFSQISTLSPSPADILFSNGQLIPQTFLGPRVSRNSSLHSSNNCSLSSSSTTSRSNSTSSNGSGVVKKCLRDGNNERRPGEGGRSVSKRVSFQTLPSDHKLQLIGSTRTTSSPKVRNMEVVKKQGEKNRGFIASFVFACRECHALEPSKHVADKIIRV